MEFDVALGVRTAGEGTGRWTRPPGPGESYAVMSFDPVTLKHDAG
ncbi:hypothetical protein [Streptomyces sp. CC224B]|nr:hypothetical protein [Streptomyces sp. CC224B]